MHKMYLWKWGRVWILLFSHCMLFNYHISSDLFTVLNEVCGFFAPPPVAGFDTGHVGTCPGWHLKRDVVGNVWATAPKQYYYSYQLFLFFSGEMVHKIKWLGLSSNKITVFSDQTFIFVNLTICSGIQTSGTPGVSLLNDLTLRLSAEGKISSDFDKASSTGSQRTNLQWDRMWCQWLWQPKEKPRFILFLSENSIFLNISTLQPFFVKFISAFCGVGKGCGKTFMLF